MTEPDPERLYANGTLLVYCGQQDAGLRAIASAIEKNYCAYSNDSSAADTRPEHTNAKQDCKRVGLHYTQVRAALATTPAQIKRNARETGIKVINFFIR